MTLPPCGEFHDGIVLGSGEVRGELEIGSGWALVVGRWKLRL
jgi:hypothetical protein